MTARLHLILSGLLLLLCACGGGGSDGADDSPLPGGENARWTYLVYLGADNNLSFSGLVDLNEMEQVGSSAEVNIVVQAEFSTEYTDFAALGHPEYAGQTLRFRVTRDGEPDDVALAAGTAIGNVDMARPETLTDFIRWGTAAYPADNYALVIWDHGAGWKAKDIRRGAVQDETSGHFMSLPELAAGVREAGIHFGVINFDACLMAMYEVAYQFSGLADFLVFSEETEPGDGDPYHTILGDLRGDPGMTPRELATTIVERYHAFYAAAGTRSEDTTKSAVDMSRVDLLHQRVTALAAALTANYPAVEAALVQAAAGSQRFSYPENHDLHDLCRHLAASLPAGAARSAAEEVMELIEAGGLVVANRTRGAGVADARGLAIYLPTRNEVSADDSLNTLERYRELDSNDPAAMTAAPWSDLVTAFVGSTTQTLEPGGFSFYIEWASDADVDLYVWEPDDTELYAPWMGQTTPNGFFSGDSLNTGISEEYYVANGFVEPGRYDILINYFADGPRDNHADVTFWYLDPAGSGEWEGIGPVRMDLSFPYAGDFSDIAFLDDLNAYSDWWYTGGITRQLPIGAPPLAAAGRTFDLTFRTKKTAPGLAPALKR